MAENEAFRPVRPEDIEAIVDIAVRAWAPIYAHRRDVVGDAFFAQYVGDWRETKAGQVRTAARERPDCVWVTERDGRPVGFTSFRVDAERRVGEIQNNAVHPDWQGRGIGSRQHRAVLAKLRAMGLTHALVTTGLDPAHAPARASYEKMGFRPMTSSVTYVMEIPT